MPSNNVGPKRAGRRRFTCTRSRGSRNVARSSYSRTTSVTRYTAAAVVVLRRAPRRFGLRWRGRLDATSREYLAPSPRHQPRPHGPPRRRRSVLLSPLSSPFPFCLSLCPSRAVSRDRVVRSFVRSFAPSRRQSCRHPCVPSPRILLSHPLSLSLCHLFRRMSPRNPRTLSFPLLSLSLSTPGVWYPSGLLSLSLFLPSLISSSPSPPSTPSVSRPPRLDAALR